MRCRHVLFACAVCLSIDSFQAHFLDSEGAVPWLNYIDQDNAGHQDENLSLLQIHVLKQTKKQSSVGNWTEEAYQDHGDFDELPIGKEVQKEHGQFERSERILTVRPVRSRQRSRITKDAASHAKFGTAKLDVERLAWLHVPKAGTSFVNTLVTWGCSGLADKDVVDSSYDGGGGMFVPKFLRTHTEQCGKVGHLCGGHHPIGPNQCNDWSQHQGNFVGLFRQPEQRVMSGFYHDLHDCPNKTLDLVSYGNVVAGCSVKMMNGHMCGDPVPVTARMVSDAIDKLRTGFAFVGLTDDWALSVCLFHAMFGGECHEREFANVRPGAKNQGSLYDTKNLANWTDPYDGPLYMQAQRFFSANAAKFGVNHVTCRKSICSSMPKRRLERLFKAS